MSKKEPIVYCLQNDLTQKTYVGYTNNSQRRLRMHTGLICGGARFTRSYRPWRYLAQVKGFRDNSHAMQFEWIVKHKRKFKSRIETMKYHLATDARFAGCKLYLYDK